MFKKKKKSFLPWVNKEKKNGKVILKQNIARQLYKKLFIPNGSIYIVKKNTLINHKLIFGFNIYGIINDEKVSLDIDTKLDFEFCKYIFKNYKLDD